MDPVIVAETVPYLSLFSAISYGIASMAMVFINKAVLMQYSHSMTLLFLQQLATTFLIHFARVMGYVKAKELNLATAKKLFPVSLFYNANVAFALASLKGVNIPMYIALKRLTPLAVLVAGFFSGKGKPPTQVSLSVLFTAFGVIIAALGDFSFDLFGYTMALTSVFFQTMYLVLVEKSGAEDGLSSVELMFYNGFLSLPFLLFLIIATGEFPNCVYLLFDKYLIVKLAVSIFSGPDFTSSATQAISFSFLMVLILSLVMGIVLNFTMFLCTIVNSALTTTIVGVLKGVGSTTLGFILLGGVQVRALNVTGLVINTAGGVWYSYAKYQQKKSKPKKGPIATKSTAHLVMKNISSVYELIDSIPSGLYNSALALRSLQMLSSPGPSEEYIMVFLVKVRDACLQEEEAILSGDTRWRELGQC
ncbi:hypothetical protein C5167_049184 [Papaver somniferum]|uniref:Sugar phosphate transporter domain-containing protein n=1 Tax=Papaver somniferum TaxID=3469 RepID=A0A4Y7KK38_PAPSO|nr:hypothetical protein C5167_049184 [Papaver somniferum]